jgi:hypothetical protein
VRKKRRKCKLYFSSKKALEKLRMRTANKEFNFRSPNKFLDFGNADVADIVGITDGVLRAIQEVEEGMILDVNKVKCANEVILCPTLQIQYHSDDIQVEVQSFVGTRVGTY